MRIFFLRKMLVNMGGRKHKSGKTLAAYNFENPSELGL